MSGVLRLRVITVRFGGAGNDVTDITRASDVRVQLLCGNGLFGPLGGAASVIKSFYMPVSPNTGAFQWDIPLWITATTSSL